MKHEWIETHITHLLVLTLLAISIGGLVEIVPLFLIKQTVETVPSVRPYTPLELLGSNIYQREGCYLCHSQMIRPLQEEWMRYGHYSLAVESRYDHPFLWGSRRIGPDLARIGGKYPNTWHVQHITAPRSLVPLSRMPNYPWLATRPLQDAEIADHLRALARTGVPYSETPLAYAQNVMLFGKKMAERLDITHAQASIVEQAADYSAHPTHPSELDALVAYLQVLGTMVDFSQYDEAYFVRFR